VTGFNNGYDKLTDEEKSKIVLVNENESICALEQDYRIYGVNGNQLQSCLAKNDTTLVYDWGPDCSSDNCLLISAVQNYCNKKGYKFYVLAEYYDMEIMEGQNNSDLPMLTPNHLYYGMTKSDKLNKAFKNDLLDDLDLDKEDKYHRYLIFKGDKLVRTENKPF